MKDKACGRAAKRSAACSTCGKTFARSDKLLRHEKNRHSTDARGPLHRVTDGTFRACQACATARSRCSGGSPCGKCNVRSLQCIYPDKRSKALSLSDGVTEQKRNFSAASCSTFQRMCLPRTSLLSFLLSFIRGLAHRPHFHNQVNKDEICGRPCRLVKQSTISQDFKLAMQCWMSIR